MSILSGIYDSGVITPVVKIRENVSIFTVGQWSHYKVEYIEGLPRSSTMTVEMVTLSGAATIAANGTIAKQVIAFLQLADLELVHLRWEPIDDMEGILWEQSSQGRFAARAVHARVDMLTSTRDPNLATTTFFILGKNRDMNLEVRNPAPVARALARFVFFGYRYVLSELDAITVKRIMDGSVPSTWIPAEGRAA